MQKEIDEKLLSYLLGEIEDSARKEVEQWIGEREEHRKYFHEFQKLHLKLLWSAKASEVQTNFDTFRLQLKNRPGIRIWHKVAAILVIAFCAGGILLWKSGKEPLHTAKEQSILPGKAQAILVLSSGEKIQMGEISRNLEEQDGTALQVSKSGTISYQTSSQKTEIEKDTEEMTNRLQVPIGGEFNLKLADGTQVWLNSETELVYPVNFNKQQRVVRLKGEAYFKVAKNKDVPFIVQVEDVSIKVYGTEFNVNTYEEIETVLIEGSVGMRQKDKEVMLTPNQKGTFNRSTGKISVENVDVLPYVAWKNGDFIFRNESLDKIMDKLRLWYGLNVFYADKELRKIRLSGNLQRYKDVRKLFHSFEKISNTRFNVQGNTVFISR